MCFGSKKSSAPAQPTPTPTVVAQDPRRSGAAQEQAAIQAAQMAEEQKKAQAAQGTEQRLGDYGVPIMGA